MSVRGGVDAANPHRALSPTVVRREEFRCGHEAVIRQADCIGCGACLAHCRFGAVIRVTPPEEEFFADARTVCGNCADGCKRSCPVKFADMIRAAREAGGRRNEDVFSIDSTACKGCGACVEACPAKAIDFPERIEG